MNSINIEKYLKNTLSTNEILNLTADKKVYYIHAKNAKPPYIEYMVLSDTPNFYSENDEKYSEFLIQVDIFSLGDFTEIKENINIAMINNGFIRGTVSQDMYEENTGLYHKALRFTIDSYIFNNL